MSHCFSAADLWDVGEAGFSQTASPCLTEEYSHHDRATGIEFGSGLKGIYWQLLNPERTGD